MHTTQARIRLNGPTDLLTTIPLLLGFRRPEAARFSFLLAIPVGLLAAAWDGLKLVRGEIPAGDLVPMAAAFAIAALSAYLVIGWLLAWLYNRLAKAPAK